MGVAPTGAVPIEEARSIDAVAILHFLEGYNVGNALAVLEQARSLVLIHSGLPKLDRERTAIGADGSINAVRADGTTWSFSVNR